MALDVVAGDLYYVHQPLVACRNVTRLAVSATPACCVLNVSECAQRCALLPDLCLAFAVAVYTETAPVDVPTPPAGATWQKCELFAQVDLTSCVTELVLMYNSGHHGSFAYDRTQLDVWDTYFYSLLPVAVASRVLAAQVLLTGVAAAALADAGARLALVHALQYAVQQACCASSINVRDVSDGAARRHLLGAAAPSARISFTVEPISISGDNLDFAANYLPQALASSEALAVLLQQLQMAGLNATAAAFSWDGAQAGGGGASAAACVASPRGAFPGLAVGLGAPLALSLAALALLLSRYTLTPRRPGRWRAAARRRHDVFLSYRRADLSITDAVHDKLVLTGLRVFHDRSGAMAGRPFEHALFCAIRDAPVFAPIVTLTMLRGLAAHRADVVDFMLAEIILALHFLRSGRVRLIFPLLVGEWCERSAASGGGERDCLPFNPEFAAARDALPAVVPVATLALVATMFKASGSGETLDAALQAATVRELVAGASASRRAPDMDTAAAAVVGDDAARDAARHGAQQQPAEGAAGMSSRVCGLLEQDAVMLQGPDEQAGLVLRHRYAQRILDALQLKS